ncbi:unnamed protein product [Prorocentrum cordatum]|uniref:RRM domain-containing protein n=1 Tax=Prorocentrum cordatum TaxID=2364126 RepID=A0ABN9SYS4_9DINO|nr:unnamed protein product [Polarella glacialis]
MPEKRVDPSDGWSYTLEELSTFYQNVYTPAEIMSYWNVACQTGKEQAGWPSGCGWPSSGGGGGPPLGNGCGPSGCGDPPRSGNGCGPSGCGGQSGPEGAWSGWQGLLGDWARGEVSEWWPTPPDAAAPRDTCERAAAPVRWGAQGAGLTGNRPAESSTRPRSLPLTAPPRLSAAEEARASDGSHGASSGSEQLAEFFGRIVWAPGESEEEAEAGGDRWRCAPCIAKAPLSQQEHRQMTLVVTNFPRWASDVELCLAFDYALKQEGTVRCGVLRRNDSGHNLYAFCEFLTWEIAERALSACKRGHVVMMDEHQRAWCVQANLSRRAIVGWSKAALSRRRRRKEAGVVEVRFSYAGTERSGAESSRPEPRPAAGLCNAGFDAGERHSGVHQADGGPLAAPGDSTKFSL